VHQPTKQKLKNLAKSKTSGITQAKEQRYPALHPSWKRMLIGRALYFPNPDFLNAKN
jgi:hypothetical protein